MEYYRKVNCAELKINAVLEDQANALRLFSKLKDLGYDAELLDYWVNKTDNIPTDDNKINKLLSKVKKR